MVTQKGTPSASASKDARASQISCVRWPSGSLCFLWAPSIIGASAKQPRTTTNQISRFPQSHRIVAVSCSLFSTYLVYTYRCLFRQTKVFACLGCCCRVCVGVGKSRGCKTKRTRAKITTSQKKKREVRASTYKRGHRPLRSYPPPACGTPPHSAVPRDSLKARLHLALARSSCLSGLQREPLQEIPRNMHAVELDEVAAVGLVEKGIAAEGAHLDPIRQGDREGAGARGEGVVACPRVTKYVSTQVRRYTSRALVYSRRQL